MNSSPTLLQRLSGWLVHLLTASGAAFGLLTLDAIHRQEYIQAFWWMGAAVFVDSFDGTLARRVNIRQVAGRLDGALLDNIIDYLNYVVVPAFFLLYSDLLTPGWRLPVACVIVITSAYQFSQVDAKTADNFFKGFPSYWNIVVFYLFIWQTSPLFNLLSLILLGLLVFVPIKYVYPSRMDHLTTHKWLRQGLRALTFMWALATLWLLWRYPATSQVATFLLIGYTLLYVLVSIYRTMRPLQSA